MSQNKRPTPMSEVSASDLAAAVITAVQNIPPAPPQENSKDYMLGQISANVQTMVRDIADIKTESSKRAESIALTVKDLNTKVDSVDDKIDIHSKDDASNFQKINVRLAWIAGLGGGIMIALQLLQIYFTILRTAS